MSTFCGCSLVVELQPSKLTMWVRFPSSAPLTNLFELFRTLIYRNQSEMVDFFRGVKPQVSLARFIHYKEIILLRKDGEEMYDIKYSYNKNIDKEKDDFDISI